MSVWSKIRGTIETIFQIGLGGPQLKNAAGVIQARNSADAAFAQVSGADPTVADNLATKRYVDASTGAGADILEIKFAIGTASASSVTPLVAGWQVRETWVEIVTSYSVGATLSVGQTGNLTEFQLASDNNLQAPAGSLFIVKQDTAAASTNPVLGTIAGGPVAGAANIIVHYVETPQP